MPSAYSVFMLSGFVLLVLLHFGDPGCVMPTSTGKLREAAGARPQPLSAYRRGVPLASTARLRDAAGARPQPLTAYGRVVAPSAESEEALAPPPPPSSFLPEDSAAAATATATSLVAQVAPGCRRRKRKPLLAVGIITAPSHFDRRVWIRRYLRVSDSWCRGVRVLFVLGRQNKMTESQRLAVRHEERAHGDIVFVNARDWVPHAVAEKSLAWWQYAHQQMPRYKWYMKTDDDSLAHLPRLERDIAAMEAMGRSHFYYGVMTWRAWTPFHHEPDAACGERGDDGPADARPSGRLKRLIKARAEGGECAGAFGPFPFADGSLQILSADLMHAFVRSPLASNFSRAHLTRTLPPFWTHEDAAVGYLILHNAIMQKLPLTFVVLSPWKHNKFWINWFPRHSNTNAALASKLDWPRDSRACLARRLCRLPALAAPALLLLRLLRLLLFRILSEPSAVRARLVWTDPSLPDAHVVNTHKVVTSMMAMIAHDAYENTTYAADPIVCVDCEKKWGWKDCHQTRWGRVPIESFGCCQKQV